MRNFRELKIWMQGMEIAREVYLIIQDLPDYEKFGLQVQLTSAAVSIPSNIAEGCGKSSDKDFKRFLEFSLGSSYELETQLLLAFQIHGLDTNSIIVKLQKEQMMLVSLINKL